MHVRLRKGHYELVRRDGKPIADANRFLKALDTRGLSPRTSRAYAFDLLALCRWLAKTRRKLRALTRADLLAFVDAQRKQGSSPRTINRRLTTCQLLYRFCTDRELDSYASSTPKAQPFQRRRDYNLGLHMRKAPARRRGLRVKTPRKIIEPLTSEQVREFLRSLRRYRDIAIVHLMLLCGLRSREVLGLHVTDVLLSDQRIRVVGKGDKERLMPLPPILIDAIADYIRLERPTACDASVLFVVLQGQRRGQPMTLAGLRSLFRHRRLNALLQTANAHRFRHTFGADMARAGVRLPILQKMMGHAHAAMTLRYIHLSMEDLTEEYQRAVAQIQKRYEDS